MSKLFALAPHAVKKSVKHLDNVPLKYQMFLKENSFGLAKRKNLKNASQLFPGKNCSLFSVDMLAAVTRFARNTVLSVDWAYKNVLFNPFV